MTKVTPAVRGTRTGAANTQTRRLSSIVTEHVSSMSHDRKERKKKGGHATVTFAV